MRIQIPMPKTQTTSQDKINTETFYLGNFRSDALNGQHHGWVVGAFMEDGPRQTDAVEIKYWEFPVGEAMHDKKISSTFETTFILEGKVSGEVNGQPIRLTKGDYVVIQPGVSNNVVKEVVEPARGLTIKAPSDPRAKKVL
jgi:quercetin dioxygenase-like cupin family protein